VGLEGLLNVREGARLDWRQFDLTGLYLVIFGHDGICTFVSVMRISLSGFLGFDSELF